MASTSATVTAPPSPAKPFSVSAQDTRSPRVIQREAVALIREHLRKVGVDLAKLDSKTAPPEALLQNAMSHAEAIVNTVYSLYANLGVILPKEAVLARHLTPVDLCKEIEMSASRLEILTGDQSALRRDGRPEELRNAAVRLRTAVEYYTKLSNPSLVPASSAKAQAASPHRPREPAPGARHGYGFG